MYVYTYIYIYIYICIFRISFRIWSHSHVQSAREHVLSVRLIVPQACL